jgi:shikimate 5-dehydrogenase
VSAGQATGVQRRVVPTMEFIGVSTGSSSIMRLFPRWAEVLGLEGAVLVGRDVPLGAPAGRYRAAVRQIREDPLSVGALVTTHKLALLAAARDLFDELDPHAELLEEVSSISKRDGRVRGHAKDPVTAGRSLRDLLGEGWFARTQGEALCLGAGGAGSAIVLHLLTRPDAAERPRRIVVADPSRERLAALAGLAERVGSPVELELAAGADASENDRRLEELAPGSLVVNATGMGKDRPGSPLTDAARFPPGAAAWELNYRGELGFLRQARAQEAERDLLVEDGWRYFLHGWSEVVAEVFDLTLDDATFARLAAAADDLRGG